MRLAWLTDLHLSFVPHYKRFFAQLITVEADAFVITGDIADASATPRYLDTLEQLIHKPIYFVYGNHDYYGGAIDPIRQKTRTLIAHNPNLHWLTDGGIAALTPQTALIGHDGWADGRFGNWENSWLELNDYYVIADFARKSKPDRLAAMQAIAADSADAIARCLSEALSSFPQVIVATHVPPFREVCWHEGAVGDDDGLPHFSSKVMGDAILQCAAAYPNAKITVLCGHTHSAAEAQIAPNVYAIAGGVEYGKPIVQRVFDY